MTHFRCSFVRVCYRHKYRQHQQLNDIHCSIAYLVPFKSMEAVKLAELDNSFKAFLLQILTSTSCLSHAGAST